VRKDSVGTGPEKIFSWKFLGMERFTKKLYFSPISVHTQYVNGMRDHPPFMTNAILNFHFVFWNLSLSKLLWQVELNHRIVVPVVPVSSCPGQLNRWYCQSVSESVSDILILASTATTIITMTTMTKMTTMTMTFSSVVVNLSRTGQSFQHEKCASLVPWYEYPKSFTLSPQKMDFWPKNGQICPKTDILGKYRPFGPFVPMPDQ